MRQKRQSQNAHLHRTPCHHGLLLLLFGYIAATTAYAATSTGSGFAVSKRQVLTAYHVVDKAERIKVEFQNGTVADARIERKSIMHDWTLLCVEKDAPDIAVCTTSPMQLGEKVYTLGYPTASILGKSIKYAEGAVSALSGLGSDTNSFQYTVPIQPGNSGGPIFNNNGLVIGIVQATINPEMYFSRTGGALPQAINFGLQIRSIIPSEINVPVHSITNRTIGQNQQCTCFITAEAPNRIENAAIRRKPIPAVEPSQNKPSQSALSPQIKLPPVRPPREKQFEDGVVSDRYKQLAEYLVDIAKGKFASIEGDAIDILSQDGYDRALENLSKAKSALQIETLRMIFMHTTDLPHDLIDNHTETLLLNAREAMIDFRSRNKALPQRKCGDTFFGVKLGSKMIARRVEGPWPKSREVLFDGIHNPEYWPLSTKFERIKYLERDDYPAKRIRCGRYEPKEIPTWGKSESPESSLLSFLFRSPKKPKELYCAGDMSKRIDFLGSNGFYFICSESDTLVGIVWHRDLNAKKPFKNLIEILEKKYNITFSEKLPNKFKDFHAFCQGAFPCPVWTYIGSDVEMYAVKGRYNGAAEELHILLPKFEEILQDDCLKAQSENHTDQPTNIDGADTL